MAYIALDIQIICPMNSLTVKLNYWLFGGFIIAVSSV